MHWKTEKNQRAFIRNVARLFHRIPHSNHPFELSLWVQNKSGNKGSAFFTNFLSLVSTRFTLAIQSHGCLCANYTWFDIDEENKKHTHMERKRNAIAVEYSFVKRYNSYGMRCIVTGSHITSHIHLRILNNCWNSFNRFSFMFCFHIFSPNKTEKQNKTNERANEQWNMQRQYNNYKEQCERLACIGHWKWKSLCLKRHDATWFWCVARVRFVLRLFLVLLCFVLFWFLFVSNWYETQRMNIQNTGDDKVFHLCTCVFVVHSIYALMQQEKSTFACFFLLNVHN